MKTETPVNRAEGLSILSAPAPSFCVRSSDTIALTQSVKMWISEQIAEGWDVDFSIRRDFDGGPLGVMWQCVRHKDGQYREFTPCIDFTGRIFRAN